MNEVLKAARDVQEFCVAQAWPFCIIGGLALIRWGEPRETIDVDVTLLTGFGQEEKFIDLLTARFQPRIPDAAQFAIQRRVLLLQHASGVGIDIAMAALPFEEEAVRRSSSFRFAPEIELRTCSAEDLIVLKAFAARGKDWVDIEGVLIRWAKRLDWDYILTQLRPLVELKGAPEILVELSKRRKCFG